MERFSYLRLRPHRSQEKHVMQSTVDIGSSSSPHPLPLAFIPGRRVCLLAVRLGRVLLSVDVASFCWLHARSTATRGSMGRRLRWRDDIPSKAFVAPLTAVSFVTGASSSRQLGALTRDAGETPVVSLNFPSGSALALLTACSLRRLA